MNVGSNPTRVKFSTFFFVKFHFSLMLRVKLQHAQKKRRDFSVQNVALLNGNTAESPVTLCYKVMICFLLNFVVHVILMCICEKTKDNKTSSQNSFTSTIFLSNSFVLTFNSFTMSVFLMHAAHFHNCASKTLCKNPA